MRLPRPSIASTMGIVILLAIDFALLRLTRSARGGQVAPAILISLFMGNLLICGAYRLLSDRGRPRLFLLGFVACGAVAVLAHLGCQFLFPSAMDAVYQTLLNPLLDLLNRHASSIVDASAHREGLEPLLAACFNVVISIVVALPQLLVALVGGWLSSRDKVVRRVPEVSAPSNP